MRCFLINMKTSLIGLAVVIISLAAFFGIVSLQNDPDSENTSELDINEYDNLELHNYLLDWDEIVDNSKYAYDGSIKLKNQVFDDSNIGLTIQFDSDKNEILPVATFDLIDSGIGIYKITGDEKYLQQSRNTASELEKNFLSDENLLYFLNPISGTFIENNNTNQEVLTDIAKLALIDSNYEKLVKKMSDEIINNEINPETQLFYSSVDDYNIPDDVDMYLSYRGAYGIESLLLAYEVTSDIKYLEQSKQTLLAYWDLRDKETNLIPSMVNSDTKKVTQEFMQQYGAGIFLKLLLHYYYLTDDPEILTIMKIYSDSVIEHFWDGNTWNYRVNYDGTVSSFSIEANFGKLDDALFLLHDLDPLLFSNVYEYAKSDYDNSIKSNLIISNNLIIHSVKDDGSKDSPQSMMSYAFLINQNIASRLYQDSAEVIYLSQFHDFYHSIIKNHKRDYGYIHGIDAYSLENVSLGKLLNQRSSSNIANKINLTFVPSENTRIIWTVVGNHELSEPFSIGFHDSGRFNNIEFDYKNRSIDMKTVYGKGTITFADKIQSVMIDGVEYTDFKDYTLNTLEGKHRYQIFLH